MTTRIVASLELLDMQLHPHPFAQTAHESLVGLGVGTSQVEVAMCSDDVVSRIDHTKQERHAVGTTTDSYKQFHGIMLLFLQV